MSTDKPPPVLEVSRPIPSRPFYRSPAVWLCLMVAVLLGIGICRYQRRNAQAQVLIPTAPEPAALVLPQGTNAFGGSAPQATPFADYSTPASVNQGASEGQISSAFAAPDYGAQGQPGQNVGSQYQSLFRKQAQANFDLPASHQVLFDAFHGWMQGDQGLGMAMTKADESLRTQLGLPEGRGLVVTSVAADGPAAKVGLQVNDVLLTLADQPLNEPEDLTKRLKESGEKPVPLMLLRGGILTTIQVRAVMRVTLAPAEDEGRYYIGVQANPPDATLRAQLGLAEGQGVVVTEVVDDSPAKKAAIQNFDILLRFNGQPLTELQSLMDAVQRSEGKPSKIDLIRKGKPLTVEVTAERRKEEARWEASEFYYPLYRHVAPSDANQLYYNTVPQNSQSNPYLPQYPFAPGGQGSPAAAPNPTASSPESLDQFNADLKRLHDQMEELNRSVERLKKAAESGQGSSDKPESGTPDDPTSPDQ